MKITRTSLLVMLWTLIGILYFPVFVCMWLLRIIARFILAISYFGMLDMTMGRAVFSSLFSLTEYGRYERKLL
jgi:hypothetical protein